jgi:hypothetical protein
MEKRKLDDQFAEVGRVAVHPLDVTVADIEAEPPGEGVVHHGRMDVGFILLHQAGRHFACIGEAVAQHGIHAVMFDVDVQEQQFHRVRQAVPGGAGTRPHGIGAEDHFLGLQHGHDVRMLAPGDVLMPVVGGQLARLVADHLDLQHFGMSLLGQGAAEGVFLQLVAEVTRHALLLFRREVLLARKQDAVMPERSAQFGGGFVGQLGQVDAFDGAADGRRAGNNREMLEFRGGTFCFRVHCDLLEQFDFVGW